MQWYEEEKKSKQNSKISKLLIMGMAITIIIILILIVLMMYLLKDANKRVVNIDGVQNNQIFNLFEFNKKDDGTTEILIPIKDFAVALGYEAYNGSYNSASEDKNKCYVIVGKENKEDESAQSIKKEVANFELDSNKITKLDLTSDKSEYEYCQIDDKITQKDGVLYTTVEGIEKALNISFSYSAENEKITIYTLDWLVDYYSEAIEKGDYKGYKALDTESLTNEKAILSNMLVLISDSGKYGVLNTVDGKEILEPKYDGIKYMQSNSSFFVSTNKKIGIISAEGKTLINPEYDSLSLIDSKKEYYLAKKNNLYGVIDGNGKEIIYIENEQIGIDISNYATNEISSKYILLDKLIPVMQNKKWGFYDLKGNKVCDYQFDDMGCSIENGSNTYGLLVLPNYNYIVVQKGKKYSLINEEGTNVLPFVFDNMYIKVSSGEKNYYMTNNNKEYNIIKTLENMNLGERNSSNTIVEKNNTNTIDNSINQINNNTTSNNINDVKKNNI